MKLFFFPFFVQKSPAGSFAKKNNSWAFSGDQMEVVMESGLTGTSELEIVHYVLRQQWTLEYV